MVNSYSCIPNSTLFEENNVAFTLFNSPLISLLVDIKYNFRDKLKIADNIKKEKKKKRNQLKTYFLIEIVY